MLLSLVRNWDEERTSKFKSSICFVILIDQLIMVTLAL